jgi:hypothetical protein
MLKDKPDGTPAAGAGGSFVRRHSAWPGLLVMATVFAALAAISWRKWPDPLIDFGQQLYVPWRLARGAVLYHDVSYVYGCLSVCYHATLFKIFGVSLNVILASNFLILIFLLLLVYRLFLKCAGVWTATTIGLALTVLAFSQLLDVGNYNYLCPYSHEEFHGLALAIVMMAGLARWLETGRKPPLALAGVCLGLIFMTKPEVFVGAVAPCVVAVLLQCRRVPVPALVNSLLLAAVCGLIPPSVFYLGFRSEMNSADALGAVCGAWLPLLHSTGLQIPIYRAMTGMDAPLHHIGQALVEFGVLAVAVGLCAWRLSRPTLKPLEQLILFVVAGGLSINYGWQKSGHVLPLLVVLAALLWWREQCVKSEIGNRKSEIGILWLAFSFFLLAKLGFNPRLSHYGVFLAMPAFLSAIYLLLHLLPRFLASGKWQVASDTIPHHLSPVTCHLSPFCVAMLIFLLAGLGRLAIQSALFYRDKDFTLGSGGDRMVAFDPKIDPTGAAMASAVAWIETRTAPTNTLAVLPEGVMLNYLTRRDNPTPYVVFAFEVWAYGEQHMLAAYEKNPPDYIVLVQRDSSEYGVPYFGRQKGFGLDVMEWVRRNYQPVELIGAEPLQSGAFGIKILKRLSPERRAD